MKSIIDEKKRCFFCLSQSALEVHHCIYGVAERKKSEQYGLKVYLCKRHHTGDQGVHTMRPDLDLKLKQLAQRKFEETHSREDWIKEFGKSYLKC